MAKISAKSAHTILPVVDVELYGVNEDVWREAQSKADSMRVPLEIYLTTLVRKDLAS
jgi:hypothetical protein